MSLPFSSLERMFPRVFWSITPDKIDLNRPAQRRWLVRQILIRGNDDDISEVPQEWIEEAVAEKRLPPSIQRLWESCLS